jgi:thiol-disulfide isomerase/thioredoxin
MKQLFYLSLVLLSAITAAAQAEKPFTFSGTVAGKDSGYLCLVITDMFEKRITDTALLLDGHFEFKGTMPNPMMAFVSLGRSVRSMNDANSTSFFLDPGETVAAFQYGDFKKVVLTGAVTQATLDSLEQSKEALLPGADAAARQQAMVKADLDYISRHPASYAAVYLLRNRLNGLSGQEKESYFKGLAPEVQQSGFGRLIQSRIKEVKLGMPGTKAIGFTSVDINGNQLSLADFKGRYVLLDFWASWCIPCRKGNPHLLELYTAYKNKGLEIIGVSDDDTKQDAWRKAVEKDGIAVWRHVLRGMDLKKISSGDINFSNHANEISSSRYGVSSLPTKILIDPSGTIIGRYSGGAGDEAALDKKLAEVFLM